MNPLKICLILLFLTLLNTAFGQSKIINGLKTPNPPKIDGVLNEEEWLKALPASGFTELYPNPQTPSDFQTEVRVLYNDEAIFIGAKLFDPEPTKILKQLAARDEFDAVNADKFSVAIDGMFNKQNAFAFGVTAAGTEVDAYQTPDNIDMSWDGAWTSSVKITDFGWVVEMKIPYSQLRFSDKENQVWGIQFFREVRRVREGSHWAAIDPKINGEVQQFGELHGLQGINPPLRLNLLPYIAGILKHTKSAGWKPKFTGGMDIKYGLNESFTLDMSLVPDFSDVLSDDLELNLGPYELFFEERRPFFTEGTEIFGRGNLFYSRRVGSTPYSYKKVGAFADSTGNTILENPEKSPLLNALKISGRGKNGIGIGIFNAITGETHALLSDSTGLESEFRTSPVTNYNLIVFDQLLPNNSYFSFTNASVLRAGAFDDSNVSAVEIQKNDKKNQYGVRGKLAFSQRFLAGQDSESGERGFNSYFAFGKYGGRFRWSASQNIESERYNPNDLGFLYAPNEVTHNFYMGWYSFKPKGIFNNYNVGVTGTYNRLYKPSKFVESGIFPSAKIEFKNFLSSGLNISWFPIERHDYFEARSEGQQQQFLRPRSFEFGGWASSDYRKPLAIDVNAGFSFTYGKVAQWQRDVYWIGLSPLIRLSNKVNLRLNSQTTLRSGDVGYAGRASDGTAVFGSRYRQDILHELNVNYLFSKSLSFIFRARHIWSIVEYNEYFGLDEAGQLTASDYTGNANTNFNAFNLDAILRWRFAPGSELNFTYKNAVLAFDDVVERNFASNINSLFQEDAANTFTLKVLYYTDWNQLKNLEKK